jgi:cell division protein FtsW
MTAGVLLLAHLSGYRLERIRAFLDPWSDIQGSGWHTAQGLIALGSGGPLGHGLGNGLQKFYWVPNAHTDAIFVIIGEELGFVGCVVVLGLFGIVAWRGFLIAWRAPDAFGRLFATGLTCMLTLQALVNIAVTTNSLPYTGITLPFVSFGGSSTVISLVAVGLLLNISRYTVSRRDAPARDAEDDEPDPVLPIGEVRTRGHGLGRRTSGSGRKPRYA